MTFLATNLFSLYHAEAASQEREIQIINQMTFLDFCSLLFFVYLTVVCKL